MQCAEDIEEILESKDRLAIGGIRPYIWQVQYSTVSSLIRTESNGIHIGRCKDRWYVFKLNYGHLEWCSSFTTSEDAERFHKFKCADIPDASDQ